MLCSATCQAHGTWWGAQDGEGLGGCWGPPALLWGSAPTGWAEQAMGASCTGLLSSVSEVLWALGLLSQWLGNSPAKLVLLSVLLCCHQRDGARRPGCGRDGAPGWAGKGLRSSVGSQISRLGALQ